MKTERGFALFVAACLAAAATSAHATWYTSESAFLSALPGPYYLEDFNGFLFGNPLNGSQTTYVPAGGNGFGWVASSPHGLYATNGAISTNNAEDPLNVTFSGGQVGAFGAVVADTNSNGVITAGTVTISLSNGENQAITFATPVQGFLGWIGAGPITGATLNASGNSPNDFAQMDHVYTSGTPVPEPFSLTALGVGAIALRRRRR